LSRLQEEWQGRKRLAEGVDDDAESQDTRMIVIVIVVAQGVECKAKQGKGQLQAAAGCLRYYVSASTSVDAYKKLLEPQGYFELGLDGGGGGKRLVP